ncbi:MAG: hypothetical protein AAF291_14310 [Pseudomonadota bacterium]
MRAATTFLATMTFVLAACGSQQSGTIEGDDGETGEYTIDTATGEATATIETEDGTATLRSGSNVPVDLPAGFTVYPGANVVSNTVVRQAGGSGNLLTMQSGDSPEKLAEFYKSQAESAGVKIEMEMATNGAQIIGGQSDDGLTFSIMASPTEDGTTAQLTVGKDLS